MLHLFSNLSNFNKMKTVLILGAGMVVKPMADYLMEKNIKITIASRTVSKAEKIINGNKNGEAIKWEVEESDRLDFLVASHDLTVSLLPYTFHVSVAKLCIKHKKNMLTTSYVSEEMKALDQEAKDAGIIILNELGLDPGIDHMTAQKIIDEQHSQNNKIKAFYSICGALPAPEAANNPLKYRFSWSPKGVVMASNNGAKFLKDGKVEELNTIDLFKNPIKETFPEVGNLEIYPNRDSTQYVNLYNIPEAVTMYRGTFRYPNWCDALDLFKALGLTSYDKIDATGLSFLEFTAKVSGLNVAGIKEQIVAKLAVEENSIGLESLEWLGLLSTEKLPYQGEVSGFDVISDLMIEKMMLGDNERDMVVMQHTFEIEKENGSRQVIKSRLLAYGNQNNTAIAETVSIPAAIGVNLILEGKITLKGVHIPVNAGIYEPVLEELAVFGIKMADEIIELDLAH